MLNSISHFKLTKSENDSGKDYINNHQACPRMIRKTNPNDWNFNQERSMQLLKFPEGEISQFYMQLMMESYNFYLTQDQGRFSYTVIHRVKKLIRSHQFTSAA